MSDAKIKFAGCQKSVNLIVCIIEEKKFQPPVLLLNVAIKAQSCDPEAWRKKLVCFNSGKSVRDYFEVVTAFKIGNGFLQQLCSKWR